VDRFTAPVSQHRYDSDQVEGMALLANGSDSLHGSSAAPTPEIRFLAERGVELCRRGEWRKGFEVMSAVAESEHRECDLPGVFYSYLGYTIARYHREHSKALALARHAVETRFFEPENYLNLARVQLLAGNRRGAIRSCRKGLGIDPKHTGLQRLVQRLGQRQRVPVPFLSRSHPVNRFLGKCLYRIRAPRPAQNTSGAALDP
jgi:hypothetical protein